jgi:hypothetical protein
MGDVNFILFVQNARTVVMNIRVSAESSFPSYASFLRHGNGSVRTHWRSGTPSGRTCSIRLAVGSWR